MCPLFSVIRSGRWMTCQAGVAWGAMAWRAPDLRLFIRLDSVPLDVWVTPERYWFLTWTELNAEGGRKGERGWRTIEDWEPERVWRKEEKMGKCKRRGMWKKRGQTIWPCTCPAWSLAMVQSFRTFHRRTTSNSSKNKNIKPLVLLCPHADRRRLQEWNLKQKIKWYLTYNISLQEHCRDTTGGTVSTHPSTRFCQQMLLYYQRNGELGVFCSRFDHGYPPWATKQHWI